MLSGRRFSRNVNEFLGPETKLATLIGHFALPYSIWGNGFRKSPERRHIESSPWVTNANRGGDAGNSAGTITTRVQLAEEV
jgi:hypothetical protein